MNRYERAGERIIIGMALVLILLTVRGVLQLLGLID